MIEFKNINKKYIAKSKEFLALKNINLKINSGEIFGLIGKSGAGKSTLLRCCNLLERPSSGDVLINNSKINNLKDDQLRNLRKKIGMIFQHFNLLSQLNVFDNIALPLKISNFTESEIKEKVTALLQLVDLSDKAKSYPDELSGGQKQRVAIARALANEPKTLLCDEATSALDSQTAISILKLLKKLNREFNMTIILITHQIDVVKSICDRVGVMDNGNLVEISDKKEFLKSPKSMQGKALIESQNFDFEFQGGTL